MREYLPKNAATIPKDARRVFRGIIYDVYQWEQILFDGSLTTFEMLKRADTVKILAIKNDRLVILEQEQPNHRTFYDIPGGMHEYENESELEAAQRELQEETGLQFKNWKLLSVVQPNPKIEQFVYTFLATDPAESVAKNSDAGEKIRVHFTSLAEAKDILASAKARFFPGDLKNIDSIEQLNSLPPYK